MTRRPLIAVVCALAAVSGATGRAHADDSEADRKARALAMLKEGRARYDLGRFDDAVVLFEQSYEVWPYPEALYNLGQAWRMKGDLKKAAFYYRAFLRNKPDAANRQEVEDRLAELDKLIAEQDASKDKPPAGTTEPNVKAPPVDTQPPPIKAPPPPELVMVPGEHWYADGWGWAFAGAGAIGVGIGGWALYDAHQLDVKGDSVDEIDAQQYYGRADDRRALAYVAGGIGAVALAGGVYMLWKHDGPHAERRAVTVGPLPGGAGLFVAGSW